MSGPPTSPTSSKKPKPKQNQQSVNWILSGLTVQAELGTFVGPGLLPLKTMRRRQDGVCPTTTEPIETVYGPPAESDNLTPCCTAGNTNTHESDRAAAESHWFTGPPARRDRAAFLG